MATTLRQIAEEAGVSPTTASLVLNGKHARIGIKDTTARRILKAAEKLHYRPSFSARALLRGRTNSLGLLCGDIQNPYFSELATMALQEAGRRGYQLVVSLTEWDARKESKALDALLSRNVDGILLWSAAPRPGTRTYRHLVRDHFPIIVHGEPLESISTVRSDWRPGMDQALAHLKARGHHRVGAVLDLAYLGRDDPRHAAFLEACSRYDIEPVDLPFRYSVEAARELGRELAKDNRGATAVLGYSDYVATWILRGLADGGKRVPEDLAIVGCDGTAMGEQTIPTLTTVRQDLRGMIGGAMDAIEERIESPDAPARAVSAPTSLVIRQSA
jgi:DNA-binding LacI/PurR family transcriptional regulator